MGKLEKLDILHSLKMCWKKRWNFSGYASRSEFWCGTVALGLLSYVSFVGIIIIVGLFCLKFQSLPVRETTWTVMGLTFITFSIEFCSLLVRRLNDTGRKGIFGATLVIISPIAFWGFLLVLVMISPGLVDSEVDFVGLEMFSDWKVLLMFIGSIFSIVVWLANLAYVVPNLFRKSIRET